jgi:hypothetical protein
LVLLVVGCGRVGFDAGVDAGADDGGACATFGLWGTPAMLAVSSPEEDYGPALTADGLELIFHSDRPGGPGGYDMYRATRPDRDSEFGAAELLENVNSPAHEENATLSADGLTMYFTSTRSGGNAVFVATRPALGTPFRDPVKVPDLGDIVGPELSADGTEMFASRIDGSTYDLFRITNYTSPAPTFERLDALSSDGRDEFYPTLTADGLTLYYEIASMHIHRAHRDAIGAPFVVDGLDTTFSSSMDDTDPDIGHDGRTFVLASQRVSVQTFDLFIWQRDCAY